MHLRLYGSKQYKLLGTVQHSKGGIFFQSSSNDLNAPITSRGAAKNPPPREITPHFHHSKPQGSLIRNRILVLVFLDSYPHVIAARRLFNWELKESNKLMVIRIQSASLPGWPRATWHDEDENARWSLEAQRRRLEANRRRTVAERGRSMATDGSCRRTDGDSRFGDSRQ